MLHALHIVYGRCEQVHLQLLHHLLAAHVETRVSLGLHMSNKLQQGSCNRRLPALVRRPCDIECAIMPEHKRAARPVSVSVQYRHCCISLHVLVLCFVR